MSSRNKSAKADTASDQEQVAQATGMEASLDTVREILFGKQARETEHKSKQLEKQIRDAISALEKQTQAQFKELQKQLDNLRKDTEKAADKAGREVAQEFSETRAAMADFEQATKNAQSELYDTLDTARLALEADARSWNEELGRQLESVYARLDHEKTDRVALAGLFALMAKELAGKDKDQ
jgi:hypothetical protein